MPRVPPGLHRRIARRSARRSPPGLLPGIHWYSAAKGSCAESSCWCGCAAHRLPATAARVLRTIADRSARGADVNTPTRPAIMPGLKSPWMILCAPLTGASCEAVRQSGSTRRRLPDPADTSLRPLHSPDSQNYGPGRLLSITICPAFAHAGFIMRKPDDYRTTPAAKQSAFQELSRHGLEVVCCCGIPAVRRRISKICAQKHQTPSAEHPRQGAGNATAG